ncbi:C2 domain-containing protein [Chlamydoabsidia padenii]|nr:C2 domain-containing protein [Chlamydoabsidia padenii]
MKPVSNTDDPKLDNDTPGTENHRTDLLEPPPSTMETTVTEEVRPRDMMPDFRNFVGKTNGLQTELGTSDANDIMQALADAQRKPLPSPQRTTSLKRSNTTASHKSTTSHKSTNLNQRIPDWYRVGWTAFSAKPNPGGALPFLATEKRKETELNTVFGQAWHLEWWRQTGVIFTIGTVSWLVAYLGGGAVTFIVLCLFLASYYYMSSKRFQLHVRDDIKRELASLYLENVPESVEWLNGFLQNFWLIFEPVLCAYVLENIDTYIVDYLPGFLDSVRLTTFTLGTKPFRVENVSTLQSDGDTVCMDWVVTFEPNDTTGMTKQQLKERVSPRVELSIRLGKGMVGAAIPVLVENMTFSGHLRVKLQLISKFPHVKLVEACFMEKPDFGYVLKPLGGDTFGFDVNNIPGLQSFVRDQAHAILGPMMYYPNVFSYDIEKFFSGELDITQANGVLAITVYSISTVNSRDIPGGNPNLYLRFYLDKAQELGRTSAINQSSNPNWNETHFLMLNNLDSKLTMELRNKSNNALKDHRVARGHFELAELEEEDDYSIEAVDIDLLRKGKRITTLQFEARYLPVSKPMTLENGSVEPAVESNSGILRFTVHECRNLRSNKVNPYAIIKINGVEKVKTPVFKRNANPKFERSGEVVVLDRTQVYVHVDIKDSVDFAENSVLGSWTSYLVPLMEQQSGNDYWWDLTLGGDKSGRIRFSVQWKPVVMSGLIHGPIGPSVYRKPIGVVRLSLWEARDLRNVEAVTRGKSDPYVRVISGSQVRARTQVIDNNLSPEWGEFHYVPVHGMREDLVLEVMDWNAKTKDKLLGSTTLRIKDLVNELSGPDKENPNRWYEQREKIDKWTPLQSPNKKSTKGELRYTAEFYPTVALPEPIDDEENRHHNDIDNRHPDDSIGHHESDESSHENHQIAPDLSAIIGPSSTPTTSQKTKSFTNKAPTILDTLTDLHGYPVKWTPDGLLDLATYNTGVLKIHIHEVKLSKQVHAYCAVMVDSLYSQFKTSAISGKTLVFNEASDAFIKEADFSRLAIEIKPVDLDEKSEEKYGYWTTSASDIIRRIQHQTRYNATINNSRVSHDNDEDDDDHQGEWFDLLDTHGGPGKIRLSFGYTPLMNFKLNPDESLENQGSLTVSLLDGHKLMAVDKSGTSDPYVIFTINGERVHKSPVVKKNNNPTWKNVQFTVPILSRVTASFRIEVFDWNQFQGDTPLGSGGISIRNEYVESFTSRVVKIPLDGVAGVSGYIRVRFLWQPQLLTTRKTHTSMLTTMRTMTYGGKSPTSTGSNAFGMKNSPSLSNMPSPSQSPPPPLPASRSSSLLNNLASHNDHTHHQRSISKSSERSLNPTSLHGDSIQPLKNRGTVTVHIIGARGLPGVDKHGTSDPFVQVRLHHHTLHKTKTIKKNLDPEWNETFQFELKKPEETILEYLVKDHNRFSASVELGCYEQHFATFVELYSRRSIDQWVTLKPSGQLHLKLNFNPHSP